MRENPSKILSADWLWLTSSEKTNQFSRMVISFSHTMIFHCQQLNKSHMAVFHSRLVIIISHDIFLFSYSNFNFSYGDFLISCSNFPISHSDFSISHIDHWDSIGDFELDPLLSCNSATHSAGIFFFTSLHYFFFSHPPLHELCFFVFSPPSPHPIHFSNCRSLICLFVISCTTHMKW